MINGSDNFVDKHREEAVIIEEAQFTGPVGANECFEEQPSEQPRQHPYRQEESGLAGNPLLTIDRETTTRNDPVNMGMVSQGRSPGMQDQGEADICPQVFRVTGDDAQGPGRCLEQDLIDHRFVVVGDIADRCSQGEDQVVVLHKCYAKHLWSYVSFVVMCYSGNSILILAAWRVLYKLFRNIIIRIIEPLILN